MFTDQGGLPVAGEVATVPTPPGTVAIYDMKGAAIPLGASFQASPYPVYLIQDLTLAGSELSGSGAGGGGGLPNTSR
jgi:hypothetical protein